MATNKKKQPPPAPTDLTSNPYDAPQTAERGSSESRTTLKAVGLAFSLVVIALLSIILVLYALATAVLSACSDMLASENDFRLDSIPWWGTAATIFWSLLAVAIAASVWLIYSLHRNRRR